MADIGKLYLQWFLICGLLILPGLVSAEGGPWVPEREPATAKEEKLIVQGCAFKAEMVFYVAQEKLYNHGSTEKLLAFLQANMTLAEYVVNKQLMTWIGQWVDNHDYKTAHEYARTIFYECVQNSYEHFHKSPTDLGAKYMQAFEREMDKAEELPFPTDGQEYEA